MKGVLHELLDLAKDHKEEVISYNKEETQYCLISITLLLRARVHGQIIFEIMYDNKISMKMGIALSSAYSCLPTSDGLLKVTSVISFSLFV